MSTEVAPTWADGTPMTEEEVWDLTFPNIPTYATFAHRYVEQRFWPKGRVLTPMERFDLEPEIEQEYAAYCARCKRARARS